MTPVMYLDISGEAWGHWLAAALIVTALAVATVITAGGVLAAGTAILSASCGVASSTMAVTVLSFATYGSAFAFGGTALYAGLSSNSVDEFADYGEEAFISTTTAGAFGAFGGYVSYNQQMTKEAGLWTTKQRRYWNSQGYDSTPVGSDGKPMQLHHPFGRYGAKEDMYYPVTYTEHREIHRELGYGRGNGGFNRYYDFDNVWKFSNEMFR